MAYNLFFFFFLFFGEEIAYHLIREFYTTKSLSIVMSPLNVNIEENSALKKKKKKNREEGKSTKHGKFIMQTSIQCITM